MKVSSSLAVDLSAEFFLYSDGLKHFWLHLHFLIFLFIFIFIFIFFVCVRVGVCMIN